MVEVMMMEVSYNNYGDDVDEYNDDYVIHEDDDNDDGDDIDID